MPRFCIFALIFVATVFSAAHSVSGDAEFCEEDGIQFKKGETIQIPGKCTQFTCEDPSNNLMMGKKCPVGVPRIGAPCHLSEIDYSKPYPECCPVIACGREFE